MSPGSKLRWLWRGPARALGRARDMYVRGVTGCARYVPADAAFGYPVIVPASLSRSCSGAGSFGLADPAEEDLRQLVRAASQRCAAEAMMRQQQAAALATATRSRSVAAARSMARIDEDAPCEFGGDGGAAALYVRSQSCVGVGGGEAAMRRARGHRKVVALG